MQPKQTSRDLAKQILVMPYSGRTFSGYVAHKMQEADKSEQKGRVADAGMIRKLNRNLVNIRDALVALNDERAEPHHVEVLKNAPGIVGREKMIREEMISNPGIERPKVDKESGKQADQLAAIQGKLIELNKMLGVSRGK